MERPTSGVPQAHITAPPPSEPHTQGRKPLCSCPQKVSHCILLKGAAREHMMFVEGGDPLDVPVESLTMIPAFDLEHREGEPSEGGEPRGGQGGRSGPLALRVCREGRHSWPIPHRWGQG